MFAEFIYGLGWILLLSAIMGYEISVINNLIISLFSFLLSIILFGNKKRIFISLTALSLLSIGGFFTMYLLGIMDLIADNISAFLMPYFESIAGNSSSIDIPRQVAVILLISILIYIIISKCKHFKFWNYVYIPVSLIALTAGFVENQLNAVSDRYTFLFFIFCSIVYYFYIYYTRNEKKKERDIMPFISIAIIYAICIIGLSQLLFQSRPYPFQAKPKKVYLSNSQEGTNSFDKFASEVATSGNIRDKFVFEGIELFKVKTNKTVYFKSIVYDTYTKNRWLQNESFPKTENSIFTAFKAIGEVENIVVNYTGIQTPILFVGPYIDNFSIQNPDIIVACDENRGTYHIENYTENIIKEDFSFSFDSLNIADKEAFKEALRKVKLQNTLPQYEGYSNDRLYELALKITEGIDNDYDKIEAIIKYLKNNYTYNPVPKVPKDNSDKIEYFLFESKEGFCQHYSSAAALLLRSLNIPARYVTGFKIDTSSSFSSVPAYYKYLSTGYKPVFDSDAHAWIEVYFKGYGWVMFESTEVGVANSNQQENRLKEEEEPVAEDKDSNKETIDILIKIGLYTGIPIVLILLIYVIVIIIKSKNAFRKGSSTYKVKIIHQIILDYLKACKYPKYNYETPQEYARRIDAEVSLNELKFSDLITTYNRIIYGEYEADADFVDTYSAFLREIKKDLKKRCKFYKKAKLFIKEFVST